MRHRDITFILAVAASLAVHLLMIPAAKHITIQGGSGGKSADSKNIEVTIFLASPDDPKAKDAEKPKPPMASPADPRTAPPLPAAVPPPPPKPPVKPKPPEADPDEEMGDAKGKGVGSNSAQGDKPLVARQADDAQAFLSRDPVGPGRVGDLPSDWTGPRGEGGSGGQRGSPAMAVAPTEVKPVQPQTIEQAPKETADSSVTNPQPPRAPEVKVAEGPVPLVPAIVEKPQVAAPEVALPPPSPVSSQGSAAADLTRKPADEVLATGPLAGPADGEKGPVALMPTEGAFANPQKPTSTAPPTPAASPHRSAVALAAQLPPDVAAQVSLPQAPTIDDARIGPKVQDVVHPKADPSDKPSKPSPPVQVAMAQTPATPTPPRVATGDGRAPGPAKPAADPAQESDSESDPFQKEITADLLRDGKLEVRKGRKIKTTRPHILVAGQVSLIAMENASIVLKISIDATGKVTGADVIQSSGSPDVDQPCRVAVYDWWIEPTHDKAGKPVPDVLVFTIKFR